jgi:teichuronic acid biosynthesis glycosyltransferase TuaC
LKILHITNNYPTERLPIFGIFVKEQIDSLNKLDFKNEILFINGREKGKFEYLKSILSIKKRLKDEKYDLIHCHHTLSAIILILSGKFIKNKVLVSFQNDPVHELGRYVFNVIKFFIDGGIFKNNSKFITNTNFFYLPNGVNLDFFKPLDMTMSRNRLGLDLNKIYILFVSSNYIRKQKRYDKFLKTLKILKDKYLYQNIEELKMINVERKYIPDYFNSANLHLLTSDFEGSPNSVKESLACNTPVVSTNVGDVKRLLGNMEASFVSEKNTAEELAYLVDKSLKKEIEEGTSQIIKLNLDSKSVSIKLKNIYKSLIKN